MRRYGMSVVGLLLIILGTSFAQNLGVFNCHINTFRAVWPQQQIGTNCSTTLNSTYLNLQPTIYFNYQNGTYLLMLLRKNPVGSMFTPYWLQTNATITQQNVLIVPRQTDLVEYSGLKNEGSYIFLLFNKTGVNHNESIKPEERNNFNPVPWLAMNGISNSNPVASVIFSVNNRTNNFTGSNPNSQHNNTQGSVPQLYPTSHQPPNFHPITPGHYTTPPPVLHPVNPPINNNQLPNNRPYIYVIDHVTYKICSVSPCFRPLNIDKVLYSSPSPKEGLQYLPGHLKINGTKFKKGGKSGILHVINGTIYVSGSTNLLAAVYVILISLFVSMLTH